MDARATLIRMLRQLEKEMDVVMSQGAGYYTCAPFAKRFNKLLGEAKRLYSDSDPIVGTFDDMDTKDPNDPSEKSKVLQEIRIEINQLITMLDSTEKDAKS